VQACAELADACRFLQAALEFDGFLAGSAHHGREEAAFTRSLMSPPVADDGETTLKGPHT
jgi:hypothetical protein